MARIADVGIGPEPDFLQTLSRIIPSIQLASIDPGNILPPYISWMHYAFTAEQAALQVTSGKLQPFDIVHCQGVNSTGNYYGAERGTEDEYFARSQSLLCAIGGLLNHTNPDACAFLRVKSQGVLLVTREMVRKAGMEIVQFTSCNTDRAKEWTDHYIESGYFDADPCNAGYSKVVCKLSLMGVHT
jgi:hypothetical protein